MTLGERDLKTIWHPYTQMKTAGTPIGILRGEGSWLYSDAGKKYLDATSSWWVNLHGHAHPAISEAVTRQLNTLEHVIFAGFTHEPAVTLAEGLLKILPSSQEKIFYSDNGSTAVEVALKMAIQFWHNQNISRTKFIVFENSYHGDTFGSMSVSARSAFTNAFGGLLFDVITVPLPDKNDPEKAIVAFKQTLSENKNEIAAFIFEPLILGAGGMLMYEAKHLDVLMSLCREADVLCIADEVMTGFGRTGQLFACDHLNSQADIICLSKGITGGTMALGATSCSKKIFDAFLSDDKLKTLFHGHSYTANPLACAAGVASLELLLNETTQQNIKNITHQHLAFAKILKQFSGVKNIRTCGTILAFDIHNNENTSYFNSQRDALYQFFLEENILLRPLGNTLYILPPYCTGSEEMQLIYTAIEKLLRK